MGDIIKRLIFILLIIGLIIFFAIYLMTRLNIEPGDLYVGFRAGFDTFEGDPNARRSISATDLNGLNGQGKSIVRKNTYSDREKKRGLDPFKKDGDWYSGLPERDGGYAGWGWDMYGRGGKQFASTGLGSTSSLLPGGSQDNSTIRNSTSGSFSAFGNRTDRYGMGFGGGSGDGSGSGSGFENGSGDGITGPMRSYMSAVKGNSGAMWSNIWNLYSKRYASKLGSFMNDISFNGNNQSLFLAADGAPIISADGSGLGSLQGRRMPQGQSRDDGSSYGGGSDGGGGGAGLDSTSLSRWDLFRGASEDSVLAMGLGGDLGIFIPQKYTYDIAKLTFYTVSDAVYKNVYIILLTDSAPAICRNFETLVSTEQTYRNELIVHRLVQDFVLQSGNPAVADSEKRQDVAKSILSSFTQQGDFEQWMDLSTVLLDSMISSDVERSADMEVHNENGTTTKVSKPVVDDPNPMWRHWRGAVSMADDLSQFFIVDHKWPAGETLGVNDSIYKIPDSEISYMNNFNADIATRVCIEDSVIPLNGSLDFINRNSDLFRNTFDSWRNNATIKNFTVWLTEVVQGANIPESQKNPIINSESNRVNEAIRTGGFDSDVLNAYFKRGGGAEWLDSKHTVFGYVYDKPSMDFIDSLVNGSPAVEVDPQKIPVNDIRITNIEIIKQDFLQDMSWIIAHINY